MTAVVMEFTAPCPCGNPDAVWRCWRQETPGEAATDYLGVELPVYRVECGCCEPLIAEPIGPGLPMKQP